MRFVLGGTNAECELLFTRKYPRPRANKPYHDLYAFIQPNLYEFKKSNL